MLWCALCCAFLLTACGGGSATDKASLDATGAPLDAALFTVSADELASVNAEDLDFLGSFDAGADWRTASPPLIFGAEEGTLSEGASKSASGWNWHKKCKKHDKKKCWSCKFKPCDHCGKSSCSDKDDQDKCKNPCKKCDKPACKDKGDKCKDKCKKCGKPDCKDKGDKCKNPCKGCGKPDCKHKGNKCKDKCKKCDKKDCPTKGDDCKPEPPEEPCTCQPCRVVGVKCETERFWEVDDCCDRVASVEYRATVTWDCPPASKAGVTVTFKRDGQVIGTAQTDANGVAVFTEDDVPAGRYDTEVCVTVDTVEPDHTDCKRCGPDKNKCQHWSSGDDSAAAVVLPGDGDELCSECPIVVYHTCVQGIVSGKGMIDFPWQDEAGNDYMAMGSFMFRVNYDNGNFSGTFTYTDRIHPTLRDVPITWAVMDGVDAWFGNENVMIHVHDAGLPKPNPGDFFEIWQFDQDFHASGNLHNCFIRNSFRYSFDCD
jgi:hypothetical protein